MKFDEYSYQKLKTPPLDISVWESNAWMLGAGAGREREVTRI